MKFKQGDTATYQDKYQVTVTDVDTNSTYPHYSVVDSDGTPGWAQEHDLTEKGA